jgi:hypothetical protein
MNYAETVKAIPDVGKQLGQKEIELSKVPIDLKSGDWSLKLVPWIGGRVISMTHHPSGKFYYLSMILEHLYSNPHFIQIFIPAQNIISK